MGIMGMAVWWAMLMVVSMLVVVLVVMTVLIVVFVFMLSIMRSSIYRCSTSCQSVHVALGSAMAFSMRRVDRR